MNNHLGTAYEHTDMSEQYRTGGRAHLILVARPRLTGSLTWHVEALIHIVLDLNSQH